MKNSITAILLVICGMALTQLLPWPWDSLTGYVTLILLLLFVNFKYPIKLKPWKRLVIRSWLPNPLIIYHKNLRLLLLSPLLIYFVIIPVINETVVLFRPECFLDFSTMVFVTQIIDVLILAFFLIFLLSRTRISLLRIDMQDKKSLKFDSSDKTNST